MKFWSDSTSSEDKDLMLDFARYVIAVLVRNGGWESAVLFTPSVREMTPYVSLRTEETMYEQSRTNDS